MVTEREQLAEAVLNHALEIICLLTVEDFIVVKKPSDGTRCTFSIRAAEMSSNMCDSSSGSPELSFTVMGMEDKTQKMIEEVANNIVWLLNREVPRKSEDVPAVFSNDEWEYLQGSGAQYKNNQDNRTIEQPMALVQQSTGKSYPMKCIKEEVDEEPIYVTEQPTAPVQQSTGNSYPMKCIKQESDEEPHVTEQPRVPVQQIPEESFPINYCIKQEAAAEPAHVPDRIPALPPSQFIPGNTEPKLLLPTVIVHIPIMEPQATPAYSFIPSCDILPPAGGSSENTMSSMAAESPKFPPSPDPECVYNIIDHIKEEPEEDGEEVCVSVDDISPDRMHVDQDEDYVPPGMHHNPSPLCCQVCGKVFGNKSSLEKHRLVHTGQRPFPCTECDKKFSCRNHLTTHMRVHSGERPYACNQCGRRFFKHQHLVLHQVVHTGEKPYSCPVCGKGFTRQSSVVKHSGMHAEQKPFVCKDCGKSYCQYASLIVHERMHSGEKPFVCKHCDKAFACKATMLKHQSSHDE